jgi:hypothetical protein
MALFVINKLQATSNGLNYKVCNNNNNNNNNNMAITKCM